MRTRTRSLVGGLCLLAIVAVGLPAAADAAGLRYFGYFAARITASGGDHLRGSSAAATASTRRPVSFYPDYAARWGRLADAVRSRIGKVGAFYLMDEPQYRGATPAELERAARTIKATFPGVPVMMVEAGPQVSGSLQIPPSVDWVGFDWYCRPFADVERTLATLHGRLHPGQSMFLVPEAAPLEACGGAVGHATDAEIARLQYDYFELAQSDPRVIGLLAFGFWTSGYDSADLPQTVAAHRDIYSRIAPPPSPADDAVTIKGRRAAVTDRGDVRVRLRCPAHNAAACDGRLTLRPRKGDGGKLGSHRFELAPGDGGKVRVRVARRARCSLHRRASRKGGVKVTAVGRTAAGEASKTLTVRATRRA